MFVYTHTHTNIYINILVIYLRGRASNEQALQHDSVVNEYWLAEHNIVINYTIWRAATDTKLPPPLLDSRWINNVFSTPTNRWTFNDSSERLVPRNKPRTSDLRDTISGRWSMIDTRVCVCITFHYFSRKIDPL